MDQIAEKLKGKQDRIYYLHDNARPHVAKSIFEKLLKLRWIIIPHPAYSPDLAPTDYHLLRSLSHHLLEKKFDDENDVKMDITNFFGQKSQDFYERRILYQQIIHYNPSVKYQAIGCPQSFAHLSKSTDRKIVSQHLSANGAQQSPQQRSTTFSKSMSSALIQQSVKYTNVDQWKMILSVCSVTATSSLSMTSPIRASIMVLAAAKEILMTNS